MCVFREEKIAKELVRTKEDREELDHQLKEAIQQKLLLSKQLEDWQVSFTVTFILCTSRKFSESHSNVRPIDHLRIYSVIIKVYLKLSLKRCCEYIELCLVRITSNEGTTP